MRYVTLTRLGSPALKTVAITIPYNGDEFEFLSPEWRGLARLAASTDAGIFRDDRMVAPVFEKE
jgi:hypothetical protein